METTMVGVGVAAQSPQPARARERASHKTQTPQRRCRRYGHGGYAGEVKIQGAQYASTYTFSEDVGNVDSRAVLVATAVVKDGVVTQVVN